MEHELKCVAKIHDIRFQADANLEIRESKGSFFFLIGKKGFRTVLTYAWSSRKMTNCS